jgi:hypothetical protein
MDKAFVSISEDAILYFKNNVLASYLDQNITIRKTISNLINTFIRHGGMEAWPELLEFLFVNLDSDVSVSMSLETINIIIEDSGSLLEQKYSKVNLI